MQGPCWVVIRDYVIVHAKGFGHTKILSELSGTEPP
ncbi:hypothetical protein BH23CHL4_BH23CHL4_21920 [soil metagenome]